MTAKCIAGILPPLDLRESLEITKIYSVLGLVDEKTPLIVDRPFREVHHTATKAALIGGGTIPHPGEISLAHKGVLFLDELPEFRRDTLEVLRQPIGRAVCESVANIRKLYIPGKFYACGSYESVSVWMFSECKLYMYTFADPSVSESYQPSFSG